MELVRDRLPTVDLMPADSESEMIGDILRWRNNDTEDVRDQRIGDSCINGFGLFTNTTE